MFSRRLFIQKIFLKLLSAASLMGLAASCAGSDQEEIDPGIPVNLGPISKFRLGKREFSVYRVQIRVFSSEQGREFAALSMVCTHQTCLLKNSQEGRGFTCPCHGSEFDQDGKVLQGPAREALHWYKLSKSPEGDLLLHTSELVESSWRLQV